MPDSHPPAVSYTTALSHPSADKRIEILRLIGRASCRERVYVLV